MSKQNVNRKFWTTLLGGYVLLLAAPLIASELSPDEQLLFFPTYGSRSTNAGQWNLTVHGWVFETPRNSFSAKALMRVLAWSGQLSAAEKPVFEARGRFFTVDNQGGRSVVVCLGTKEFRTGKSQANGHLSGQGSVAEVDLPQGNRADESRWISLRARLPRGDAREFAGSVLLLGPEGISVVSDIDDTIKVSQVMDKSELLQNTFCRPFRAVPGMARLYQVWSTNQHAQFHYVSASPWQLYPALNDFIRSEGFPQGTFHLKMFRWKDQTFLDLFKSPEQYKNAVIQPLFIQFPKRQFILVGDCGEKDPEIYGALARTYPAQVARIFIRELHGTGAHAERYGKAFRGIPQDRWKFFLDPSDIANALAALKQTVPAQ
jgi:hypothetical protein